MSVFIAGLKPHLRRELNLRRPTTLSAAFALAREIAALHVETHSAFSQPQRRSWSTSPQHTQTQVAPVNNSAPNIRTPPSSDRASDIPICRLTNTEKMAKDAQGLCYWCDQKWTRGHRCQSRLLLPFGDEENDDTTDSLSLDTDKTAMAADISSLNSLSGATHPRALRLDGSIHASSVHVLIDGGSTHNFIHPRLVKLLKLSVAPITPFRVYVGNGDSIPCTHQSLVIPLHMQGHDFQVDLLFFQFMAPMLSSEFNGSSC